MFPVLVDALRRLFVGNDEFEFEHRLGRGKDLQEYGVRAVLVLEVIGFTFLTVSQLSAIAFHKRRNLVARALGDHEKLSQFAK